MGRSSVCIYGVGVVVVAFGANRDIVHRFARNLDHRLCGVGSISFNHVERDVPGWIGNVAYCPGISFPLCMDDRGFGICRAKPFMVGINLAVCSQAARSVMYEK